MWEVEEFRPSDGSKSCGVEIDHTGWLRCRRENRRVVHMSFNMSSIDMPADEARAAVDRMVTGLNA